MSSSNLSRLEKARIIAEIFGIGLGLFGAFLGIVKYYDSVGRSKSNKLYTDFVREYFMRMRLKRKVCTILN